MTSYQKNLFEAKDSISTEFMSRENEELPNEYIFIQCACFSNENDNKGIAYAIF